MLRVGLAHVKGIVAEVLGRFGVWWVRGAVDHECTGRMGFEEVVDVWDDGYYGGRWCEEG